MTKPTLTKTARAQQITKEMFETHGHIGKTILEACAVAAFMAGMFALMFIFKH